MEDQKLFLKKKISKQNYPPSEYSSIVCKIGKRRNKVKRHSITCSHFWHIDISVCVSLITHIIGESLVEIQQFRHGWSSKMYKNIIKTQ